MAEIDWAYVATVADSVAHSIARDWAVVEKDDVKQQILLNAYERRKSLEDNWGDTAFLYGFCRKVGVQYASAERDGADLLDGQYYYTPQEARQALETFLYSDEELGQMLGTRDDLLKCRITDNIISARLDATKALGRLPKESRELLMRWYVFGIPWADDAEKRRGYRAVDALARQMNRDLRKVTV